jgi:hypothetical protein
MKLLTENEFFFSILTDCLHVLLLFRRLSSEDRFRRPKKKFDHPIKPLFKKYIFCDGLTLRTTP